MPTKKKKILKIHKFFGAVPQGHVTAMKSLIAKGSGAMPMDNCLPQDQNLNRLGKIPKKLMKVLGMNRATLPDMKPRNLQIDFRTRVMKITRNRAATMPLSQVRVEPPARLKTLSDLKKSTIKGSVIKCKAACLMQSQFFAHNEVVLGDIIGQMTSEGFLCEFVPKIKLHKTFTGGFQKTDYFFDRSAWKSDHTCLTWPITDNIYKIVNGWSTQKSSSSGKKAIPKTIKSSYNLFSSNCRDTADDILHNVLGLHANQAKKDRSFSLWTRRLIKDDDLYASKFKSKTELGIIDYFQSSSVIGTHTLPVSLSPRRVLADLKSTQFSSEDACLDAQLNALKIIQLSIASVLTHQHKSLHSLIARSKLPQSHTMYAIIETAKVKIQLAVEKVMLLSKETILSDAKKDTAENIVDKYTNEISVIYDDMLNDFEIFVSQSKKILNEQIGSVTSMIQQLDDCVKKLDGYQSHLKEDLLPMVLRLSNNVSQKKTKIYDKRL